MTIISFFQDNYLGIVFTSFFTSFISAIFFLLMMKQFKPNILISPEIAQSFDSYGKEKYTIKVINKTKYNIYDIEAQLHIVRQECTPTGCIEKTEIIAFKRENPFILTKFDKKDKNANYAYRFLTYENLNLICATNNINSLRFRLICKHELSGILGYFNHEYIIRGNFIKNGNFIVGDSFEIDSKL